MEDEERLRDWFDAYQALLGKSFRDTERRERFAADSWYVADPDYSYQKLKASPVAADLLEIERRLSRLGSR